MSKTKTTISIIVTIILTVATTLALTRTSLLSTNVSAETANRTRIKSFSADDKDQIPTKTVDNKVNKFLATHNGKIVNSQTTATKSVYIGSDYIYTYTVTIEY